MLADTSLPHGFDVNLTVVGTLSEGFRRVVAFPPYLVGYMRWDAWSDRCSSTSNNHLQQLSGRTVP
jgi:hypothetical protein